MRPFPFGCTRAPRTLTVVYLATILLGLSVTPGHATNYTISTFGDDDIDNGNCTLREAMDAALRDIARDQCPAGTDTDFIQLLAGTYTFDQGEYFSARRGEDLSISGSGPGTTTVFMGFQNRFLHYDKPAGLATHIVLDGFSLVGGRAEDTATTPANGGAIRARLVHLTLNEMQFSLNATTTSGNGGAVSIETVNNTEPFALAVFDTVFDTNVADVRGGGLAVDAREVDIEIRGSRFENNESRSGGGFQIRTINGTGVIDNTDVIANQAASSGGGGLLADQGGNGFVVTRCQFRDNVLENAGPIDDAIGAGLAMSSDNSLFEVESSVFVGNRTTSTNMNREVEQVAFTSTDTFGATIWKNLIIADSPANAFHVVQAESPGAVGSNYFALSHATITGNGRAGQVDDLRDTAGVAFVELSIFFDNNDSTVELNGNNFVVSDLLENIDPLFVDGANEDFHLQAGSPAIDIGVAQSISNLLDLDGVPRPQGRGFDAGAFERQGTTTDLLFMDGFESGGTDAWTDTVP